MDLPQALSAITAAVSALKLAGNAVMQTAVADLNIQAARVLNELATEVRRNADLQEENRILKERLALRGKMEFDQNLYWQNDSGLRSGPFCPGCLDDKSKAIRMIAERHRSLQDYYECPVCNLKVDDLAKPRRSLPHRPSTADF